MTLDGLKRAWRAIWSRSPGEVARLARDAAYYQRWVKAHTRGPRALRELAREVATWHLQPRISVLTPVFNTDPQWLHAAIESVRRQVYPHWELCIVDDASTSEATREALRAYANEPRIRIHRREVNGHIAVTSSDALAMATGEFVALLDHDDELSPDALAEVVRTINAHPAVDVIYSDEDKLSVGGSRCDPFFKPDWSPEHFLGQMYTCHLTVARTTLVRDVGGFRAGYEGSQDYDLWLRMMARTSNIHHVPRILYHWRKIPGSAAAVVDAKSYALDNSRRALEDYARNAGIDAVVEPGLSPSLWRVRRRLRGNPDVAVIVNAPDPQVGDESSVPRRLNRLIRQTTSEYVVILGDGVEMRTPLWTEGLLEYAQDPAIGIVGGKLRAPDGRLVHVGIVTGVRGVAAHLFESAPADSFGWNGGAVTVRNYSVVSGAMMMFRRSIWEEVGGFDERFHVDFADVDFCLRVRDAGYRIVFTPFVEGIAHQSVAHVPDPRDETAMQMKWGDALTRDPYYNPNLDRGFTDCRL